MDPARAPLIRMAFSWYATGDYTLRRLVAFLDELGLRNRAGGRVTISGLSHMLRNPFYMGCVHLRSSDKLYPGLHEALISKELFFAVQARLKSRLWPRRLKHRFKYSRRLTCATCGRSLVGSLAKGRVYYRCATMSCPTTCVREDDVDNTLGSLVCNTPHEIAKVGGRLIILGAHCTEQCMTPHSQPSVPQTSAAASDIAN
ncbi:MAG TPA: recombinase family protein [Rubrobacter sp.]|nr:recombinase family protein [Rubrobacter sp.]